MSSTGVSVNLTPLGTSYGLNCGSESKESACNSGDPGSNPGWEISSGEGNGNLLQYSCLRNPMDRGAWQATVHGFAKSRSQLSTHTHTVIFNFLRNHHTIFRSHWTIVHFQQQCKEVPISPHPHQHLLFSVFWIMSIRTGIR